MPKLSELLPKKSKFLKKEDFPQPALVTVESVGSEEFTDERTGNKSRKLVVKFKEFDAGMVMGWTVSNQASQIFGSDDTDHWIGCQAVIFNDPSVTYAGKQGGLRLRKTKQQIAKEAQDSDVPF